MIAIIDGHQQDIAPIDALLLEVPFNHILLLVEGGRSEEGIQQLELRVLGKGLLHELDVHIDDIIVQPLTVIYSAHRLIGQLLYTLKTGLFDLHGVALLVAPDELRALEVLESDERVVLLFFAVLAEPKLRDLCLVIPR